jgi:transcriptional regulator with XRE-family HTH domain
LKLLRVAAGLTQAQIAKALVVSKNYVYLVESGRRQPSLKYLKAFADKINVPLSVIHLEPPPKSNRKTKKLFGQVALLLAEYANAVGVRSLASS